MGIEICVSRCARSRGSIREDSKLLKSCAAFTAGPLLSGLRIKVAALLLKVNSAANSIFCRRKKNPRWAGFSGKLFS
jgi:hypothetical protein